MPDTQNFSSETPLPELEAFYSEFLQDRFADLAQLQASFATHDLMIVKEIAHRWKGFCEPYGFGRLGGIAAELEVHAKNGDDAACAPLIKAAATYLAEKKSKGSLGARKRHE